MNASLVGAVSEAVRGGEFDRVLGSRRGIEGILSESFVDLTSLSGERLARLRRTPSAALGTTRHRPDDGELERILDVCRRHDIEDLAAVGGNDTAETLWRLVTLAGECSQPLRGAAIPKTIDNDLAGTDHSPGFGSAARYIALAARDAVFDTVATAGLYPVKIIEVMGRNAGWLAASAVLGFEGDLAAGLRPPLVCFPERPLPSFTPMSELVNGRVRDDGYAVLVVPETLRWADGSHVAGDTPEWVDLFGHPYFPSAGHVLARRFSEEFGYRARYDKPGTIARMAMHAISEVDLAEAERAGAQAVRRLAAGETGIMVSIERCSDEPYRVRYGTVPVSSVAGVEHRIPDDMITPDGNSLTGAFFRYARPLLGDPQEPYERLG